MNATKSALLSAAVAGLLLGTSACTKETPPAGGNAAGQPAPKAGLPADNAPVADLEKHACKGMNTCKGKGGCGATKGKNECAGKGECATVAHHTCSGKNDCKAQGGCKSGDNGCKGKNSCKGKGGCGVPIKH